MSLLVDKKVLESQYTRNNLNIHYKLISLYVNNLNSIATTCALISSLSFSCIHEFDYPTKYLSTSWRFGYFYSLFSMCAVISAILGLSQSTICVIFGPTMFLFGDGHIDSLTALKIMKNQQDEAGFWTGVCVFMALLQSLFFTWGVTHFPLSCFLTFVHLCGYYIIYKFGQKTINELNPPSLQSSINITENNNNTTTNNNSTQDEKQKQPVFYRRLSSLLGFEIEEEDKTKTPSIAPNRITLSELDDLKARVTNIRRRGYLWTKNFDTNYQADYFKRIFVVLENGELSFYREQEDFIDLNESINNSQIYIKHYQLHTSKRIITQYTHQPPVVGIGLFRKMIIGTQEVLAKDYMNADFDIQTALISYKFVLIPTTQNELLTLIPLHFMAEDELTLTEWIESIEELQSLYQRIDSIMDKSSNIKLHQNAQASLKYAAIVDRLPNGMEV